MKGLESLIPHKNNEEGPRSRDSVFLLDIGDIKTNPYQPRKEFNKDGLKELAESIKTYGVLQPILVTKVETDVPEGQKVEYELIAGERRLRAAKLAKLPRIPAVVKRSTNKQKLEVSLIENVQRNDLNAVEEAFAFQRLSDEFNMKQAEIAERVGKSVPYVANTMRIISLPEATQKALADGTISEGHTRPLLALKDTKKQKKLFDEIAKRGLTVRQAEERSRELTAKNKQPSSPKTSSRRDTETERLLSEFKDAHNIADARLRTSGRRARLALHFSSKKELQQWIRSILR